MITINNLTKTFGSKNLFKDFNLSVKEGEMVAIVGDSGSGKSTLLNIIGSLEAFEAGEVEVNGKNIKNMKHKDKLIFLREDISFLFQNYALMEDKTVHENITMIQNKDKTKSLMVEDVLRDVNLLGLESRMINSLSGGEQQRVALARTMLKPSKLILADEPTGNLDDTNSTKVWDILLKLNNMGKTVVVVTHDKRFLSNFDHVINL